MGTWIGWGLGALLVASGALWALWRWMGRGSYTPGGLAARDDLEPVGGTLGGPLEVRPGIVLHSFAAGSGGDAPPTLFVHGGPGLAPTAAWRSLEPMGRVIYVHQRGCGASTRPIDVPAPGSYPARVAEVVGALGLTQHLADLERVRRLAGDGPVRVVGHSFGAYLAALYAAEIPEAVTDLVLLAPADLLVMPPRHRGLFGMIRDRLPPHRRGELDAFLKRYLEFGPSLFDRTDAELARRNAELGEWFREAVAAERWAPPPADPSAAGGWMVQAAYLSMGRHHDHRPALRRITARTLVVHGRRDLQPLGVSEDYRDAIAGAELAVVDAGHFLHDCDELASRLSGWLDVG